LTDQAAEVIRADGQHVRIEMEAMKWAKAYIDVDTTGRTPRFPADVLKVGDLIRIQATGTRTVSRAANELAASDVSETTETVWRLAQLPEIQGALVSLDPQSGAVLALEGGFDFGMNQYNHALQAARQPGSGFKPFVYSAALHAGVTPASLFMDAPLVFNDQNLESQYRPDNDNNRYNGPTRLRVALYRSINLVSIRVLLKVGAGRVMDYVRSFGFDTSTFPRNTQLAIGGGTMAVTPMDMVNAYAVFANGGWLVQPHIINQVIDLEGQTIFEAQHPIVCDPCNETLVADLGEEPANLEDLFAADPSPPQSPVIPAIRVVDERNIYIMNSMLRDVIRRGTGRRARTLERNDLAGKTGTTNDAADTWFNGFNPDVATTVWVGFPNHQPLGRREYGSNTPLPIWIDFMAKALAGKPETAPSQPAGVVTMKIDPLSGELAAAQHKDAIFELFLTEHTPPPAQEAAIPDSELNAVEFKPVDIF
jgi:penicillin-binding protein 1A